MVLGYRDIGKIIKGMWDTFEKNMGYGIVKSSGRGFMAFGNKFCRVIHVIYTAYFSIKFTMYGIHSPRPFPRHRNKMIPLLISFPSHSYSGNAKSLKAQRGVKSIIFLLTVKNDVHCPISDGIVIHINTSMSQNP